MANPLVVKTYQQVGFSLDVPFTPEGYFNATKAAQAFGTTPKDWLRTQEAQKYIESLYALAEQHQNRMITLDEEFITAVIRPPVSIRKVRAMAKKQPPQSPLSF